METALVVAEGALLLLLLLIVTGLLRSHAEILRALHALGADVAIAERHGHGSPGSRAEPVTAGPGTGSASEGLFLDAVVGVTPSGEVARVALDGGGEVLLVFLSSGCRTCAAFWEGLRRRRPEPRAAPGTGTLPSDPPDVVVVTRDPSEESVAGVAALAPPDVVVVMSSRTWEALAVPGSPYVAELRGGRVVGSGVAASWQQVEGLVSRARADRHLGGGAASGSGRPRTTRPGDGRRGADTGGGAPSARPISSVDTALLDAGLTPGHPSLYGVTLGSPPSPERRRGSEPA